MRNPDTARLVAGWGAITKVVSDGAVFPLGAQRASSEIKRRRVRRWRIDDDGAQRVGRDSGERTQQAQTLETSISSAALAVVAGRLAGAPIASSVDGSSSSGGQCSPLCLSSSPSCRHRDRQQEARSSSAGSRTSRQRCGASATSWPRRRGRRSCSRRSERRWRTCSGVAVEHAILRDEADGMKPTVVAVSARSGPGGICGGRATAARRQRASRRGSTARSARCASTTTRPRTGAIARRRLQEPRRKARRVA